MSSYVKGTESRGVGAIASKDLGAVAIEPNKATMAPTVRTKRPRAKYSGVQLISRKRRGAVARRYAAGRHGKLIKTPSKRVVAQVMAPAPSRHPMITSPHPVSVIERPTGVVPAGVLTGSPPTGSSPANIVQGRHSAVHSPVGPTVRSAVSKREAALNSLAATELSTQEIDVPQIPQEKATNQNPNKTILYVGLGLAGLAAVWIMSKD